MGVLPIAPPQQQPRFAGWMRRVARADALDRRPGRVVVARAAARKKRGGGGDAAADIPNVTW